MDTIFFTSNYYTSPFQVGDHHLARAFAADGWRVAFISAPITPFHLFSSKQELLKERLHNYRQKGQIFTLGEGEIHAYVPGAWLVPKKIPLLNSRNFHQQWHHLITPSLTKWLAEHGFSSPDLLYFSSSRFAALLKEIPTGSPCSGSWTRRLAIVTTLARMKLNAARWPKKWIWWFIPHIHLRGW